VQAPSGRRAPDKNGRAAGQRFAAAGGHSGPAASPHVNDGEAMKPDMEISDDVIAGLR
jgi:hypothetical protein